MRLAFGNKGSPRRVLRDSTPERGLDLSLGTVTDGLHRLLPLFEPVYEALAAHRRRQPLWHADETRWLVFATIEGKVGFRWYLWAFHTAEVVVLAQGRSHDVTEDYLGPDAEGIMVVDRYQAYPVIDQVQRGQIVLAFCEAHVRRDFVTVARTWPEQEGWALAWVERIGALYQSNDARLAVGRTRRSLRWPTRGYGRPSRRWGSTGKRRCWTRRDTPRGGRCWRFWATTGRA